MVEVGLAGEAARQFEFLSPVTKTRMLHVLERLSSWPDVSGAKPLRGTLAGHHRIRTGDCRVQFRLDGATVLVESDRPTRPLLRGRTWVSRRT
jgi:mRNA-degrading endonuclease RelE of RelBE toxin-antitoxin system